MKNTIKICLVVVFAVNLSNYAQKSENVITVEKSTVLNGKKKSIQMKSKYPKIKGSGKIATETRKVEGNFEKISSSTFLEVIIEQTDNYEIIVEADDNIIPYIVTEISSNKLKVYFDKVSITNFKQAKVYVKLPKISELSASSSSSITTDQEIKSNNLKIETNSSGDIVLTELTASSVDIETNSSGGVKIEKIITKNLDINSSSSGSVKIEYTEVPKIKLSASSASDISIKNGKTTELRVKADSAAEVNAKNLSADNVIASASSSSNISVFPNLSLDAKASSTGGVYYYNKPQIIEKETSSMGTIKQR